MKTIKHFKLLLTFLFVCLFANQSIAQVGQVSEIISISNILHKF